jgi:hypothetical protein
VRRKSRTSALRLSISSTEKAWTRRCQGYNSPEEAAAAAAAAAADTAAAAADAAAAAAAAPALEAAADTAAAGVVVEAAGGAVALEAAAAAAAVVGAGGVGAVVGAVAACHGEGARSANRATFRLCRHVVVVRAGIDHVRSGNEVPVCRAAKVARGSGV